MTKPTAIEIKDPRPDIRIAVTPPAEAGLPYKATIRMDYTWIDDVEDPEWKGLLQKLSDYLFGMEQAAAAVRGCLDKVTPPPLPEPPVEEASLAEDEPAKDDEVIAERTGSGWPVVVMEER